MQRETIQLLALCFLILLLKWQKKGNFVSPLRFSCHNYWAITSVLSVYHSWMKIADGSWVKISYADSRSNLACIEMPWSIESLIFLDKNIYHELMWCPKKKAIRTWWIWSFVKKQFCFTAVWTCICYCNYCISFKSWTCDNGCWSHSCCRKCGVGAQEFTTVKHGSSGMLSRRMKTCHVKASFCWQPGWKLLWIWDVQERPKAHAGRPVKGDGLDTLQSSWQVILLGSSPV